MVVTISSPCYHVVNLMRWHSRPIQEIRSESPPADPHHERQQDQKNLGWSLLPLGTLSGDDIILPLYESEPAQRFHLKDRYFKTDLSTHEL